MFVRDINSAKISGNLPENVLLGTSSSFQVEGVHNLADFSARIIAPSEQEFVPKIIQISQTECRIEWVPYELGEIFYFFSLYFQCLNCIKTILF